MKIEAFSFLEYSFFSLSIIFSIADFHLAGHKSTDDISANARTEISPRFNFPTQSSLF
jgi:hypothetical protein